MAAFGQTPITADCNPSYRAYHKGSFERKLSDIKWIVMHDTEGGSAESVAYYFSTANAGGSAHLVVDDKACFRCLQNEEVPWAAPGANVKGFHIEQCGYAKWSLTVWKKHMQTLNRAAYKTAFHCHKFNIPPAWIKAAGLRAGLKGVTSHAECTKAFGGDHTDPGPLWPRWLFMQRVKFYYKALGEV